MKNTSSDLVVVALYRFAKLPDFESFREPLYKIMLDNKVRGTILLAGEGINGTIAGTRTGVDQVISWLRNDLRFEGLETKESYVGEIPFYRTKVKLKKEIVTMGVEDIDPNDIVGTYIDPQNWNDLISDPDVFVLDTRNKYEISRFCLSPKSQKINRSNPWKGKNPRRCPLPGKCCSCSNKA